jgi:hypothetical protein
MDIQSPATSRVARFQVSSVGDRFIPTVTSAVPRPQIPLLFLLHQMASGQHAEPSTSQVLWGGSGHRLTRLREFRLLLSFVGVTIYCGSSSKVGMACDSFSAVIAKTFPFAPCGRFNLTHDKQLTVFVTD